MEQFVATWKVMGWIVYLALAGLLFVCVTMGPFIGGGFQAFLWGVFLLGLSVALTCTVVYRRNRN